MKDQSIEQSGLTRKSFPRFMVAAPSSGSGKTSVVCAILSILKESGKSVCAAKCGPDYIDPMFHKEVLGIDSLNLDLFFSTSDQLKEQLLAHAEQTDLAVAEGVMGYYDGRSMSQTKGSSYEVATVCGFPVILVIDARGSAVTLASLIFGMVRFMPDSMIRGVILNRVSKAVYPRLKTALEGELAKRGISVAICGHLETDDVYSIGSRHLGLVTPDEMGDIRCRLEAAGRAAERTIDMEKILSIARQADPIVQSTTGGNERTDAVAEGPLIAVARDEAFCFYYGENLRCLEKNGCRITYFSPLSDRDLPAGTDGLLLGGGYPELYARQLSENVPMRERIRQALADGMPCLAECGGFLYLNRELTDDGGISYPMVGFFGGASANSGRLGRFGYVSVETDRDLLYLKPGEQIKGHEFHYWDCSDNGSVCRAVKPDGRKWLCSVAKYRTFAGFVHMAWWSLPAFAARFAGACRTWRREEMNRKEEEGVRT